MFITRSHGKKMEEWEQWASEEEERTMRREVGEEELKIEGEGGVGWQWGALCLASSGETCLWRGAAMIVILAVMATARAAAQTRSLQIANVQQKGKRGDQDDAEEREDNSRTRHVGIWVAGVTPG
jgi:hypothetical protein